MAKPGEGGDPLASDSTIDTTPKTATSSKKTFNFKGLAPEIRNKIYAFSFVYDEPVDICHRQWLAADDQKSICPPLLLLNKAIHNEAISLLYKKNRFSFAPLMSDDQGKAFELIGSTNLTFIEHMYLDLSLDFSVWSPTNDKESELILLAAVKELCPNLKTCLIVFSDRPSFTCLWQDLIPRRISSQNSPT